MLIDFAERYRKALADEIHSRRINIGRGTAESYEKYKARCAETNGLEGALNLFNDLLKQYVDDDD